MVHRTGRGQEVSDSIWKSWTYWWLGGRMVEGQRLMLEALASDPELATTPRARLLTLSATLGQARATSNRPGSNEQSMELFRKAGDKDGLYFAMGTAGLIALGQGHPRRGSR